ncbi:salicylate synthase [Streptomyces phaeoluteigriseus]|uniref:Salicylate synthase n=1 Tax=Streptomyces phaeoluteigriseus TaxID=114686 RepID=A0ABY4Z9R8_9ACTN|nr:salicylate synthase [Streptomyces phaeoluteigriseus]USQ85701.1 salicylate synthase [Streptomyces phaeoluteigriseus]
MVFPYQKNTVPIGVEPLVAATGLVASGLFSTYVVYESADGWSVAGGVAAEVILKPDSVRCTKDGTTVERPWRGDPLTQVREFLDGLEVADWRAYGWSAFELAYAVAGRPVGNDVLLHLVVPRTEIRLSGDQAHVRGLDPQETALVEKTLTGLEPEAPTGHRPVVVDIEAGADAYRASVTTVVDRIRAGRLQKAVVSRTIPVTSDIDFPASYLAGRRANTPARSYLLNMGGLQALGFSPETVVEVEPDGTVSSQPLAGTRALTGDADEDRRLRENLLADPKELHEHAISVKVAVDELAGPCKPETVVVQEYMVIKERGSVQHLASRVVGRMPREAGPWDAFAAVFPAVTASGVPKHPAYDAISAVEPRHRGLYAGTVMTVAQDGSMDAALALRSVFRQNGETWLQAGAGIVEQSVPERELEETREKLRCVAGSLVALAAECAAVAPDEAPEKRLYV